MLYDVLEGLSGRQKTLPSRLLYDARGSDLFEDITVLPEYYPTRTERAILTEAAPDLSRRIGAGAVLVEYGAGAWVKTRILLDALEAPAGYVPIDVSDDMLAKTKPLLQQDYPDLPIHPVVGNFLVPPPLPDIDPRARRVGFFPGSTIGNLDDADIETFLAGAAEELGPDGLLVLGVDLKKSPDILIPAYDDAQGVTADFNRNLLVRINRELGADFNLDAFRHEARWNEAESRMEMHLVSLADQSVTIGGRRFDFAAGETIHTENSRKFDQAQIERLLAASPWQISHDYRDSKDLFSVLLLERK
ncbi:MAG: L-histidine N(alpha)-methyltransferase [Nisaea sp.]|uniref:L-histidine N(alpha)-methyltransferase n=1 Tax=Nisaea sp. TaxID=2024842 RepID=UPI003297EB53